MCLVVFSMRANAQSYNNKANSYNNNRPSWEGRYNGQGIAPGYHYNPRSGWNTLTTPNGNWIHYRDGYVPMRSQPSRRRYYYQNYYGGSYADIMSQFIW